MEEDEYRETEHQKAIYTKTTIKVSFVFCRKKNNSSTLS